MAYNLQDQEQIDELKAFWANNGNRLMWLAVIALAVFAGWRVWNWYHDGQAQDAAREYAGLLSAADSGKIEQVRERYDAIQKGYGSSVYAGMAGLLLDQKKYDEATKAIDTGNIGPVSGEMAANVADRRGDILAAQGKASDAKAAWEEALKLLPRHSQLRSLVQYKLDAVTD